MTRAYHLGVREVVRTESSSWVRTTAEPPSGFASAPVGIVLAAAAGCTGPLGFVLGWGPVAMDSRYRPLAGVAVIVTALVVATVVGTLAPRRAALWFPVLLTAGAVATWSSAGRVHGLWCVLATSGAALVVRTVRIAGASPTRMITGAAAIVGIVGAGLLWGTAGAGVTPLAALLISTGLGVAGVSDVRFVRWGDGAIEATVTTGRSWVDRVVSGARRTPLRLRSWLRSTGIRIPMALSGLAAALLTAPIFHRLAADESTWVNGFNDFHSHLELAAQMQWSPLRITAPHPVFHVSVRLLGNLLSEPVAVTVVLSTAVGLSVASLTWIATQPLGDRPGLSTRAAPLFALGFLFVESPAVVLQALRLLPEDTRYATVHIWANPTEVMVLPFVFLLVVKVAEVLGSARPDRRLVLTTAALTLATTITKPALTLALVPGVLVIILVGRSAGRRANWTLVGTVVLPATAIIVWQTWFLEAGNLTYGPSEFELQPLRTIQVLQLDGTSLWFWSALVIIPLAVWIGRMAFVTDRTIQVTAAALVCGLAIMLLVHEGGIRQFDSNLAKPAYYAWMLLFAWSFRYVVAALVDERTARRAGSGTPLWAAVAASVIAVLAIGGVTAWLDAIGIISIPVPGGSS